MFNEFPYTNFHELNLDWILKEIRRLKYIVDNIKIEENNIFNDYADSYMYAHVNCEGVSAQGMDIHEYNNVVYCACSYLNAIELRNFDTGELIEKLENITITHPNDITFVNDTMYWVNGGDNKIQTYNLITKKYNTISTKLNTVHGLAYNKKYNKLLLLDNSTMKIYIYDTNIIKKYDEIGVSYGDNTVATQGIYSKDDSIFLIGSRRSRDNYGSFNFANVYNIHSGTFIKKINFPFAMELESLSYYDNNWYTYYNCYSHTGNICIANVERSVNNYGRYPMQNWGFGRWNTYIDFYINENGTNFFVDGSTNKPFLHWFECSAFMDLSESSYFRINLLSNLTIEFDVNSNNNKKILVQSKNSKYSLNIVDIRHMSYVYLKDIILNDSASFTDCSYVLLENCDINSQISLNQVPCARIRGNYTVRGNSVINSDRIFGVIRIDNAPTNMEKWSPFATPPTSIAMPYYELCTKIYDYNPVSNMSRLEMPNNSDILDIIMSGTYLVPSEYTISNRPDNKRSIVKLTHFNNCRHFEYYNINDKNMYFRTIHDEYDTGWVKIITD